MTHGLPETGVQALDGVGRVDDWAQLDGEREERHEIIPRAFPGGDHRRVAITPVLRELGEAGGGRVDGGGGVGLAQLPTHRAPVLLGGVAQARADQVHHAQLYLGLWPGRSDRVGERLKAVAADDEGVLDAAVAELGEDAGQNFAPSPPVGPTHIPSTSRSPWRLTPMAT